jgi:hypothetical protein
VAWDLWEHPISILHHHGNVVAVAEWASLDHKVQMKYQQLHQFLLNTERYLLSLPLYKLISEDAMCKRSCPNQATSALARLQKNHRDTQQ